MKIYSYISGKVKNHPEIPNTVDVEKGPKKWFTSEKQRNEEAEIAAIATHPLPVYKIEVTGVVEVKKPAFMHKSYTSDGELLPEKG